MTTFRFPLLLAWMITVGCATTDRSDIEVIKLSTGSIDSIKDLSDSVAIEESNGVRYKTMETYYDTNDDIATRLLKDSTGNILSVIKLKNGKYLQSKLYYPNGQLKGKLSYSSPGVINGPALYYYKDGRVKTMGTFKNNKRIGEWKHYDKNGFLVSVEHFSEEDG